MRSLPLTFFYVSTVLSLLHHTSVSTACTHTRLHAASATEWRVACSDGAGTSAVSFAPSSVQRFLLDHNPEIRSVAAHAKEIFLSSAFDRVDPLESATITHFTLQAEPLWVHTRPVTIVASAFAKLSKLQILTLQDVPLADTKLHLLLPASIQKLVIVGCRLQRFSFEIVGGGTPDALLEVDLHANDLVEIPRVLFALPSSIINVDVRLNKLSTISVASRHELKLQQWMEKGVFQIDNLKNPCPLSATTTRIQGHSQQFDVCVVSDTNSDTNSDASTLTLTPTSEPPPGNNTSSSTENARDADSARDDPLGPPPASVHSPSDEAAEIIATLLPPQRSDREDTVSKTTTTKSQSGSLPTVYVALVSLGVVSALLLSFLFARAVVRRRESGKHDKHSTTSGRPKSRSSLLTSATTDDLGGRDDGVGSEMELGMGDHASRCSEADDTLAMERPPSPLDHNRRGRSASDASSTTAATTPINGCSGRALYTTLTTPQSKSYGDLLTSRTTSRFSIRSLEKESQVRHRNKQRLAALLRELSAQEATIDISGTSFVCHGDVTETDVGALMVSCRRYEPATESSSLSVSPSLAIKIYVEQDVRVAIREYRALLVMQSHSCMPFVSQMVATDMEKTLANGLKCAVLVVETGSSTTTLRHIVRNQINRTRQLEVVQQLYAVIKALECLHERQFIHGGLHLEALAMDPSDPHARLKFRDLEHATRFGDTIQTTTLTGGLLVEYTPPEMAMFHLQPEQTTAVQQPRASSSFDVWCLGILILKIYANSKQLDEFDDCSETFPSDLYRKLSHEAFHFDKSLALYVHHDDVRDLARACLRREPRKRPTLSTILSHRVFRAYDRLEQNDLVASLRADRLLTANKPREVVPPTIWFFLPPRALDLRLTRSVDDWIHALSDLQQQQQQCRGGDSGGGRFRSQELLFPLVFVCEDSHYLSTPCSSTGVHHARLYVPASLLPLAMPLVQEATLFLEAKAILSTEPKLDFGDVSGLGAHQWSELMKFYRALETMRLAPISSFSVVLLKPLEELLATHDVELARQVLDELKCLLFSQDKRDHVRSLLDILQTLSVNAELDGSEGHDLEMMETEMEDEDDDDGLSSRRATLEWARLRKCELESDASTSMPSTRWLCRRHWECEMECEV